MLDLCITNCRLPDGSTASIGMIDGRFACIGEERTAEKTVDGRGLLALPCAIDTHVHFRTPDDANRKNPKETWDSGERAAIRGGICHVVDMPNNNPAITTRELLHRKIREIGNRHIGYSLLMAGAVLEHLVNSLEIIESRGEIIGIKLWMGSSTGNILVERREHQKLLMITCALIDRFCFVHAEQESVMATQLKKFREKHKHDPRVCDHCFIRDPKAEYVAVMQALTLQREILRELGLRVKLYFCHVSTPEAIEIILAQKHDGHQIWIEVCPHHFTLDQSYLSREDGFNFKMNPPLRTAEQCAALKRHVCTPGHVDCIGSDHAPHRSDEKRREKYGDIPSGVPGIQDLVPLTFGLYLEERMTLEHFQNITSRNAAKLLGINKGRIDLGVDADFYLIDPIKKTPITAQEQESRAGYTPYEGMIACKPELVVIGGSVRYDRGTFYL